MFKRKLQKKLVYYKTNLPIFSRDLYFTILVFVNVLNGLDFKEKHKEKYVNNFLTVLFVI